MSALKLIVCVVCVITATTSFTSCKKSTVEQTVVAGDKLIATGMLRRQGATFYMYGSHILEVSATESYVLTSNRVDLDKYIGERVQITALNTHYTVEQGPELYDVSAVKK